MCNDFLLLLNSHSTIGRWALVLHSQHGYLTAAEGSETPTLFRVRLKPANLVNWPDLTCLTVFCIRFRNPPQTAQSTCSVQISQAATFTSTTGCKNTHSVSKGMIKDFLFLRNEKNQYHSQFEVVVECRESAKNFREASCSCCRGTRQRLHPAVFYSYYVLRVKSHFRWPRRWIYVTRK